MKTLNSFAQILLSYEFVIGLNLGIAAMGFVSSSTSLTTPIINLTAAILLTLVRVQQRRKIV